MAKSNFLKKNEGSVFNLLILGVVFIFLGLIIPAIGYADAVTSPAYWVSTVDFFTTVRDHISSYWMFYTISGAVLYLFFNGNLKLPKGFSTKKNQGTVSNVLLLVFVFVISSLIIPAIGYADAVTSPAYWVSTVDFFTSVRDHVVSYWMFYTLGGAILFKYFKSSKK